jgi:predicted signal transduction protein with EAL and GGDEF domain
VSLKRIECSLELRTTIEGVETSDQAQHARALGCDYGERYLWGFSAAASAVTLTPRGADFSPDDTGGPVITGLYLYACVNPEARSAAACHPSRTARWSASFRTGHR